MNSPSFGRHIDLFFSRNVQFPDQLCTIFCMASSAAFLAFPVLVALHLCCCHCQAAAAADAAGSSSDVVAAIYSLGDSITDTGNLIKEAPRGMFETIKHLPYGVSLGYPTGRCSDGLLMIDFLAQDLGLPFLNPYLGKNKSFDHGVNFAVAGATAMDTADQFNGRFFTPFAANSLNVQLRWFKDFMKSSFGTDEDIRTRLQSSLVLIGEIGGNDYNYALFGKNVSEVEKLIPGVVQTIVDATKEVLDMGANRVIIPGNFPIGCMPTYLTTKRSSEPSDYDSMGCLRELNLFAGKHNARLQSAIADELRPSYPAASIAYADYFNSFLALLASADSLGFDASSARKACCGAGGEYNYDWRRMCGAEGTAACAEPEKYVSWDGIHMTQAAYRAMSRLVYHGRYLQPQILNLAGAP
ncbi:acetylajmalan esterase-like [Oryza brachyantha]|uniref:Esterase n=1 Tax=Oryza brachyantha TaxID=4533 RepID=J3MH50_ORYBR|nr:acetylajmalan esterase-like [Oryza brachyantha]